MFATVCQSCGHKLRLPEASADQRFLCPRCGGVSPIPDDKPGPRTVHRAAGPETAANIPALEGIAIGLGLLSIVLLCIPLVGYLAFLFSGIGLLLASRAENTQTVNGLINLVQLPMFVASGVFFYTARFPAAVQPWLRLLPLTALNDAMRAVMIDGAGLRRIIYEVSLLTAFAVLSFGAALRLFRWR